MARVIAVLLFFSLVCVEAQAQNENWGNLSRTPERLIGLLDLPDIVAGGCGPAPSRATTRAFATPSQKRPSVGTVYWREEGSAWIRRTDPNDFLPFPEILRDNLAHTMPTWDGTLRATPGTSGRITPLSPGWKALTDRPLSVQYLGSRRVGNDIWLRIRLAAKGPCDQTYENVTDVEGWIPAYHADRTPLAWFSSRGC